MYAYYTMLCAVAFIFSKVLNSQVLLKCQVKKNEVKYAVETCFELAGEFNSDATVQILPQTVTQRLNRKNPGHRTYVRIEGV